MWDARPIEVESLGERLARELRRGIILGEIADGARLVEEELATTFGVSRGPVRDAVKLLRTEGLVSGSGRHVVARPLSDDDIDELMALREAFEVLAVERAMRRHPQALARELADALSDMEAAAQGADIAAFTCADLRFHSAFFAAADMTRLSLLWNQFRPTIEGLLDASGHALQDLMQVTIEHQDLAKSIANGEVDTAKNELHRHLSSTCMRLQVRNSAD